MRPVVWIATIVVALVIGLIATYVANRLNQPEDPGAPATRASSENSPVFDAARQVVALGRIEPAGGVIQLHGPTGDRLLRLEVAEGDQVQAGQTLAVLASRELRRIELAAAQAELAQAQERLQAEQTLADARITAAEAALEQAQAQDLQIDMLREQVDLLRDNAESVRREAERLTGVPDTLAGQAQRERAETAVRQAEGELRTAESRLEQTIRQRDLGIRTAEAELSAARAGRQQVTAAVPIESLKAAVARSQHLYDQTQITAPTAGTVLRITTRPGEATGMQPILHLADLSAMSVVAEVFEADVKRLRVGQAARVVSRALDAPHDRDGLNGTVSHIAQVVSRAELRPLDPTDRADRRTVDVRVRLDDPSARHAARLVNLQVDVVFPRTSDER